MKRIAIASLALLLTTPASARQAPSRPSIDGIAYVRIHSTKLETSVPFFQGILGLVPDTGFCIQTVTSPPDLRISPPLENTCKDPRLKGFYLSESQEVELDPS